jgi:predicted phage gp36 major capsid-like protein
MGAACALPAALGADAALAAGLTADHASALAVGDAGQRENDRHHEQATGGGRTGAHDVLRKEVERRLRGQQSSRGGHTSWKEYRHTAWRTLGRGKQSICGSLGGR